MHPNHSGLPNRDGLTVILCVLCAVAPIPVLLVIGVLSFFQLSGETSALRASALETLPRTWNSKVAVHVGFFTTGLVRFGSRFFKLPPEAQAGIASLPGSEVNVYKSQVNDSYVDNGDG